MRGNWYTLAILTVAFLLGIVAAAFTSGCRKVAAPVGDPPSRDAAAPVEKESTGAVSENRRNSGSARPSTSDSSDGDRYVRAPGAGPADAPGFAAERAKPPDGNSRTCALAGLVARLAQSDLRDVVM